MRRFPIWQGPLVVVMALAGCATVQPQAPEPQQAIPPQPSPRSQQPAVNLAGYSPEFKRGHADGCASVQQAASRVRDEKQYKAEPQYAQGWHDGYAFCSVKRAR